MFEKSNPGQARKDERYKKKPSIQAANYYSIQNYQAPDTRLQSRPRLNQPDILTKLPELKEKLETCLNTWNYRELILYLERKDTDNWILRMNNLTLRGVINYYDKQNALNENERWLLDQLKSKQKEIEDQAKKNAEEGIKLAKAITEAQARDAILANERKEVLVLTQSQEAMLD